MHSRRRVMCGRGNPIGMPGATPSEWEPPPKVHQINGRGVVMADGPAIVVTMAKPPSANRIWRNVPGLRHPVRSEEYNAWLRSEGWNVKRQIVGMEPLACRFDLVIEVPISRRDTDNFAKPIGDLCQYAGVVTNDGNVRKVTIEPVDRTDCMAAFWPLPEMGAVRKAAKPVRVAGPRAPRKKPGMTWLEPKRG